MKLLASVGRLVVLPGTIVHEFSHLLAVLVTPGAVVTQARLTSHVSYRGQIGFARAAWIAYLPVLVNTACAAALFAWLQTQSPSQSLLVTACAGIGAFSVLAGAFPSTADATTPITQYKAAFPSFQAILTAPLFLVYTGLTVAILIPGTLLRSRSVTLYVVSILGFELALWHGVELLVSADLSLSSLLII